LNIPAEHDLLTLCVVFTYLHCTDVISWPIRYSARRVVSVIIAAFWTCVLFCWYRMCYDYYNTTNFTTLSIQQRPVIVVIVTVCQL